MVIGDPYRFAVIVSLVDDWNMSGKYKNGIIFFSIAGVLFPKEINTSILDSELLMLVKDVRVKGESDKKMSILFDLNKQNLIEVLYCDDENDKFKISTLTMEDVGYYFYAIKKDSLIRIIGCKIVVGLNENIYSDTLDVIIENEEYESIKARLKLYYLKNMH